MRYVYVVEVQPNYECVAICGRKKKAVQIAEHYAVKPSFDGNVSAPCGVIITRRRLDAVTEGTVVWEYDVNDYYQAKEEERLEEERLKWKEERRKEKEERKLREQKATELPVE